MSPIFSQKLQRFFSYDQDTCFDQGAKACTVLAHELAISCDLPAVYLTTKNVRLDYALFCWVKWKIRSAERGVWKMRSVENAECGK